MAESSASVYDTWEGLHDTEITDGLVQDVLGAVPDDLWAAAACVDRIVEDTAAQHALLVHGLSRTDKVAERFKDLTLSNQSQFPGHDVLLHHFQSVPGDAQLCQLRSILLERLDRWNTYVEMEKVSQIEVAEEDAVVEEELDEWEDDPWAEEAEASSKPISQTKTFAKFPLSLPEFLLNDLKWSTQQLATLQYFDAVQILFTKHPAELWPSRFPTLDAIPEHADPTVYRQLLPSLDQFTNLEATWKPQLRRETGDFSERPEVQAVVQELGIALEGSSDIESDGLGREEPLSVKELCQWYSKRVDRIIAATGLVDAALAIVQHGASQGIPGLDELGEELSLLSRLVYDTPYPTAATDDYTLTLWTSMKPEDVVRAYLSRSSEETLANDISHLVMPYLYVLEAKAERAGAPDPGLPDRLLHDYILSIPLPLAAAVFEASKPTLPAAQRVLKDDEDVARLALACLYGSDSLKEWSTMSRIFECMPAWDIQGDRDTDEEAADTTLSSLGNFVRPTTARPTCSAKDMLAFFKPLSVHSLSRALDILDIHLESGEILSRWSVPAPLRWFLQSHDDLKEQKAWATRMARRAGGSSDPLNTQEDWDWLLEDMLKLTESNDSGLRGAFGLLTKNEVYSIYLSGLLSTGKYDIARRMLQGLQPKIPLAQDAVEDICLKCSNELYDNASSGNYKVGDMKLAYECLDVPPSSERIRLEKDFIEATSRIASFNVMSRAGAPISPIEIRLTKDRLSLISRVLSSNSDAYKHTQVMLDLTHKLGFRDDVTTTIKVIAMLAETALQAEDFPRAFEDTQRMVAIIQELRVPDDASGDTAKYQEALDVCWIACYQLGRQPEFTDLPKKLQLLGQALDLCPADKMHDVLTAWRRLQKEDLELREERLNSPEHELLQSARPLDGGSLIPQNVASSLRARLRDLHMPSPPLLSTPDAAALASRTFKSVASNFPFSIGHRTHSMASEDNRAPSRADSSRGEVESQASRAFSKGIGWLIGADDE